MVVFISGSPVILSGADGYWLKEDRNRPDILSGNTWSSARVLLPAVLSVAVLLIFLTILTYCIRKRQITTQGKKKNSPTKNASIDEKQLEHKFSSDLSPQNNCLTEIPNEAVYHYAAPAGYPQYREHQHDQGNHDGGMGYRATSPTPLPHEIRLTPHTPYMSVAFQPPPGEDGDDGLPYGSDSYGEIQSSRTEASSDYMYIPDYGPDILPAFAPYEKHLIDRNGLSVAKLGEERNHSDQAIDLRHSGHRKTKSGRGNNSNKQKKRSNR